MYGLTIFFSTIFAENNRCSYNTYNDSKNRQFTVIFMKYDEQLKKLNHMLKISKHFDVFLKKRGLF